jgi:hypothetical protein
MPNASDPPTPYPEVNILLRTVLDGAHDILGDQFIGMCVEGSLANGGFDQDSDVDFVIVTKAEVSGDVFTALQAMHERLSTLDVWCATQLEGSYVSAQALRRHDPALTLHPNIERGAGERLKMADHDQAWDVHRWILRERGIVLAGPAPQSLIDPVTPDQLRRAMQPALTGWAAHFLEEPALITHRGYQSYIVLTLCRILYTLRHGAVASKPLAAQWAREALGARWAPLIDHAWEGRHHGGEAPSPEDVAGTLAFIRTVLKLAPT